MKALVCAVLIRDVGHSVGSSRSINSVRGGAIRSCVRDAQTRTPINANVYIVRGNCKQTLLSSQCSDRCAAGHQSHPLHLLHSKTLVHRCGMQEPERSVAVNRASHHCYEQPARHDLDTAGTPSGPPLQTLCTVTIPAIPESSPGPLGGWRAKVYSAIQSRPPLSLSALTWAQTESGYPVGQGPDSVGVWHRAVMMAS